MVYHYLFFFQTEDGIRYGHVTGVQTCALPISRTPTPCAGTVGTAGSRRSASRAGVRTVRGVGSADRAADSDAPGCSRAARAQGPDLTSRRRIASRGRRRGRDRGPGPAGQVGRAHAWTP